MKKGILRLVGRYGAMVLSFAAPLLASAQFNLPCNPGLENLTGFQDFICTIVVNWLFTFLILLVIVFVIVAAYRYLTAAGDPEKVKSASNTLIYAAIAVIVALLARSMPVLVGSLISGSSFTC